MFNYEGPFRGDTFFTKKCIKNLYLYSVGAKKEKTKFGFLGAYRDFVSYHDTIRALDLMAHSDKDDDYCISTGKSISMEDFMLKVCKKLNINKDDCVGYDSRLLRPKEVEHLRGSYDKINKSLGWSPEWDVDMIIDEMIEHEKNEYEKLK
jgi:GDPmannose 4,6-dehydratase